MTISDLISELEYLAEVMGDETEVRIASQPSWPFEYSIAGITSVEPNDVEDGDNGDVSEPVVYLVEGNQIGYLPSAAKDLIGW